MKQLNANFLFNKISSVLFISYIFFSPLYKNITFISFFGFNILTIIIFLLFIVYLMRIPFLICKREKLFFSIPLLIVLLLEFIFNGELDYLPSLLGVTLFAFFLQIDKSIKFETLYKTIVISCFFSAGISFYYGVSGNLSLRNAAVYVDGSIALITLAIILFYPGKNIKHSFFYQFLGTISSIVVLLFGVSRARILIALLLVAFYIIYPILNKDARKNSKLSITFVGILLPVTVFLILFSVSSLGSNLLDFVFLRFSDGLTSSGRNDEITFASNLVQNKWLFGAGWKSFYFINSDGSRVAYDNHNCFFAIFVRGGIVATIAFAIPVLSLIKNGIRYFKKTPIILVLIIVFLLLCYGNAGFFNYTICSITALISVLIKKEIYNENIIRFKAKSRIVTSGYITNQCIN